MLNRIGFKPAFWWFILVSAIIGLVIIAISSIVSDPDNTDSFANFFRTNLNSTVLDFMSAISIYSKYEVTSSIVIGFLLSLLPLSYIYLFKIPDIRKMAITILTAGYYENFLSGVINTIHKSGGNQNNAVLIILPSYELVGNKKLYWERFTNVIALHDFHLKEQTTDKDFGRNILHIYRKDGSPFPIFLDMPTTLTNLKKIIELEDNSPAGSITDRKWRKQRFFELRKQFQDELTKYVEESDWGNIRFIEGTTLKAFEEQLNDVIQEQFQTTDT